MRHTRKLAVLLTTLLTLTAYSAEATPAPTTTAPPAEELAASIQSRPIVFQEGGQVRTMLPDGSEQRLVAETAPEPQEGPDWSPDGRSVTFHTEWSTLWTADVETGVVASRFECVAPCVALQDPAWSPDGTEVAFMVAETVDDVHTSRSAIVAVNLASGDVRTIYEDTSGTVWLFAPRWSPDGASIVFESETFASNLLSEEEVSAARVAIVDTDGGASPTVVAEGGPADWSSAGDLLVFARDDNLFLVAPDGTGERQLTEYNGQTEHAIQPTFTPDGAGVVFTYVTGEFGVDDAPTAAIIALDGTGFTTIGDGLMTHPRLRP